MSLTSGVGRVGAVLVLLAVAACGTSGGGGTSGKPDGGARAAGGAQPSSKVQDAGGGGTPKSAPTGKDVAVSAPGALSAPLLSSDILVYGKDTLATTTVAAIKDIPGVAAVEPIAMGTFYDDQTAVTYAAVNPATFRRFTPPGTAQTTAVWRRVAQGEIAVEPSTAKAIQQKDGYVRLGNEDDSPRIHIGAYADIIPHLAGPSRIQAVVNYKWTRALHMRPGNALIVSLGSAAPRKVIKPLKAAVGSQAAVQVLAQDFDPKAVQTAFLTGGSVSAAVGSFSYRANPDGTVTPDPAWVARKIRTEQMPIIGSVTGNVVMLPQLRGALNAVLAAGLSRSIYHYDGCYVPRFIAKDPSKGLSFHTYGTAIDLNASDNQRGGAGKMDRRVVAIFKQWGFAWGGDWHYTDPMHFELAHLAKSG